MIHLKKYFEETYLLRLFEEFSVFRSRSYFEERSRGEHAWKILPFVRGLRLSAQIIYIARKHLNNTDKLVDWGHLLNEGEHVSPECDIIIYRNGYEEAWNGGENASKVMDFKFIESQNTLCVISCKSLLDSSALTKEKTYPTRMAPFCQQVVLFAECIPQGSFNSFKKRALRYGFTGFYYLYEWDANVREPKEPAYENWTDFIQFIKNFRVP